MALRLVQITLPGSEELGELLDPGTVLSVLQDDRGDDRKVVQVALPAEETEALLDALSERYGETDGFHVALLALEALLPRPEEEDEEAPETGAGDEEKGDDRPRISREELYNDITDGLEVSWTYLAMISLSAIVAAVGLLRDDLAVVIGAMVIAPLLQPNVALGLAATLGDVGLAVRGAKSAAAGLAVAFALSFLTGLWVPVDPSAEVLASRTVLALPHLALAFAAGAAGTLAYTRGLSGAVIGVMVSVALLPPLVAAGVLLGAGEVAAAAGAGMLTAGNTVCINLAAIATFLVTGVRPRSWWEAKRAKRATVVAAVVWTLLLVSLVVILALSEDGLLG